MGRVLAIDGPAASGKSTTARRVAEAIGVHHLNSGQLYRAITWMALREGWREEDPRFEERVAALQIELISADGRLAVRVEGLDPGPELQSRQVADRVSHISRHAVVRERVLELLRTAGSRFDVVCDGRDIGTVVFPRAELKVFLTASPGERARRRLLDHGLDPDADLIAEEARRLRERDRMDSTRVLSPLRKAEDATEIDTTHLSPEEVVRQIVELWGRTAHPRG